MHRHVGVRPAREHLVLTAPELLQLGEDANLLADHMFAQLGKRVQVLREDYDAG